jgi:MFS family permease
VLRGSHRDELLVRARHREHGTKEEAERETALEQDQSRQAEWQQRKMWSTYVIYAIVALNWTNLTVMQSIFPGLEQYFGFSPSERGLLVTARVFSMFATLPIYGWLSDRFMSRNIVITAGLAGWTTFTFCHVFVTDFEGFMLVSVATGCCMGVATPLSRSLISHYFASETRGQYFGYIEVASGVGGAIGVFVGSFVSTLDVHIGPFNSLHLVFAVIALLTFPCIFLAHYFVVDPVKDENVKQALGNHLGRVFEGIAGVRVVEAKDVRLVLTCRVWLCLVGQGMVGSIPWTGLSYLINWFQVMRVENTLASFLFIMVAGGAAVGGAIGGHLGDFARKKSPRYGRIIVSQASVALGIPLVCVMLLAIPRHPEYWYIYLVVGVTFGATISWPPPNNSAICGDVIEPHLLSTAFSLQYMLEGSVGSWGTAFVGIIAEKAFHVTNIDNSSPLQQDVSSWLDGLANSILLVSVVPWFVCLLFYIPMYFYYPKEALHVTQLASAVVSSPRMSPNATQIDSV